MMPNFARVFPIWLRTTDQALLDSEPEPLAEIKAGVPWGRTVNGAEDGRILPMMAPQGPATATPRRPTTIDRAANELGNGTHSHLSTVGQRVRTVKRLWGKAPVKWIDDFGFYDVPVIGAHMSGWTWSRDPPFLAGKTKCTVSHCPSAAAPAGAPAA